MRRPYLELILYFFRLGATSFGGPSVYIAMMEDELVGRRQWLGRQAFFDYMAATYLIPGPNSVKMAGAIGYHRAGVIGAVLATAAFVVPAFALSALAAWFYVRYGTLPESGPFLDGIKPVVVALILVATLQLGRGALRGWQTQLIAAVVAMASVAGFDEVLILVAAALGGAVLLRCTRHPLPPDATPRDATPDIFPLLSPLAASVTSRGAAAGATAVGSVAAATLGAGVPLWKLGLFFLKIGAVLYGGGYVLVAYIQHGLVDQNAWLTRQQLLDAVAIGQITPGPFISTAAFVGYLLCGVPGAAVASAGIIAPACVLVPLVIPWTARLRRSQWAGMLLDCVMAASIGLMAAVVLTLGRATMIDWQCWLIGIAALAIGLRWKVAPVWLVLLGAAAGRLLAA